MAMRHHERDAYAAHARKTSGYRPGWHPVLSAVEVEPGVWEMIAQFEERYAVIRLLRIGDERGYRVTTWAERSQDRELVGYFRTLMAAAAAGHATWIDGHAQPGMGPPGR
jgi:hypothetical protein